MAAIFKTGASLKFVPEELTFTRTIPTLLMLAIRPTAPLIVLPIKYDALKSIPSALVNVMNPFELMFAPGFTMLIDITEFV